MDSGFTTRTWAAVFALALFLTTPLARTAEAPSGSPLVLTRAGQVRELSPAEARRSHPVRLTGVVTFSDPAKGLLFVQDDSGSVFVSPQAQGWDWPVGEKVELTGTTAQGSHLPYVNQAVLRDLGAGEPMQARRVTFARLAENVEDGNWVEIRGVVRAAAIRRGQPVMEIAAEGRRIRALFSGAAASLDKPGAFVDAEVSLRGVAGLADKDPTSMIFMDMHVPGLSNLVVTAPASPQAIMGPVQPLAGLSAPSPTNVFTHRVRVQGKIFGSTNGVWRIADNTSQVKIHSTMPLFTATNTWVDVLGFPGGTPGEFVLEDATVYKPALAPKDAAMPSATAENLLPVLTQAEIIRNLPVSEAGRGYPVSIQGVATYADPAWGLLFVQDETSGINIVDADSSFTIKAGQRVVVEGYSGMGPYAPVIRRPVLHALEYDRMPLAKSVTYEQLKSGLEDSQRVEVRGIVRYLSLENGHLCLTINTASGRSKAYIPDFGTNRIPSHLVDAEIQARGVCDTVVNKDRQWTGFRLLTADMTDIRVIKPAPTDPFSIPLQPVNRLFQFRSQSEPGHRVHVRGTVTFRDPQWCTLVIQDDVGGLYIRTLQPPNVSIGDRVDAAGFVDLEAHGMAMSEALFQRLDGGVPPTPDKVDMSQIMSGEYQSRLVALDARLLDRIRGTAGRGLILQGGQWEFTALLESTQSAELVDSIREGSLVRLTGICRLEGGDSQSSKAFRLQLRTPADIVVLKHPPRWTKGHWMAATGFAGLLSAAAAGWVILLRRNVREQTGVIRRELEKQAALERQYGELFDNVNDLIQCLHPDGSMAYANPAWLGALGYSGAEALRLGFRDFVHRKDEPSFVRCFEQAKSGGKIDRAAFRFCRKDGGVIEVEGNFNGKFMEGRPVAVQSIFRDVTLRNHAEAELRKVNRALHALSECNQALIRAENEKELLEKVCRIVTTIGGYGMAWVAYAGNDTAKTVYPMAQAGFEAGFLETLSLTWKDAERGCGPTGAAIRTRQAVIARGISADPAFGAWMRSIMEQGSPASAAIPMIHAEDVLGALTVYSSESHTFDADEMKLLTELAGDIAYGVKALRARIEHRRAEEALLDSERKYRELVEHANSIILRWTHDGRITFMNEFGQRFFGYSANEIIGRHVMETIVPPTSSSGDDLRKLMDRIAANPTAFEQNVNENVRRDGSHVWIAWTNRVVRNEQGNVAEILSIGTDVSERKKADDEIRELNASLERRVSERTAELVQARDRAEAADRLKSAFLATMSHELRTPLNSIIGFTGIMIQGLAGPLNAEQRKQLDMVRDSARHLLALINDVLDISKIEAGQLAVASEPVDLRACMEKVAGIAKPMADKKGLDLRLELAPEMQPITSDRRRIEQVLLNLLNNAIKFTEKGGVVLSVIRINKGEAGLHAANSRIGDNTPPVSGAAFQIGVRDTGIGIKAENLSTLFQPFRQIDTGITRQHEGTGLGLAICRKLVGLMGGEIWVESEWGKGSVFQFTLPLEAKRQNSDTGA